MKKKAYAKINLTLDILGRRADGFHEMRTVIAPISLYDCVTVEKSGAMTFECDIPELRGEENYCVRARNAFFSRVGSDECVDIKLQKHIPYPAGLGGGSADAAAVLNALNELFGFPLSEPELSEVAAEVGSDVPVCMKGVPALCEGRGEILTPLSGVPKLYVTVAIGSGRLSTALVFKEYDAASTAPTDDTARFLARLEGGNEKELVSALGNAFTDVCARLCPETKEMRRALRACGAEAALLSGSGPSVYGVFFKREQALRAARDMRARGFFAVDCETLENTANI